MANDFLGGIAHKKPIHSGSTHATHNDQLCLKFYDAPTTSFALNAKVGIMDLIKRFVSVLVMLTTGYANRIARNQVIQRTHR